MLEELKAILQPPVDRAKVEVDAERVRLEIGTRLPGDYIDFMGEYGAGKIDDFLIVLAPFQQNHFIDLKSQVTRVGMALAEVYDKTESKYRPNYFPFPRPGGVLPWGVTDNGDLCFWETQGEESDLWPVVLCDARMWDWEKYDCGMVEFVAKILTRQWKSKIFPDDFPSEQPSFVPV